MKRFLLISLLGLVAQPALAQPPGNPAVLVSRWYRQYLHRDPDAFGLDGWAGLLRQGEAPEWVLANIIGSEEYYANAGGTPRGFVAAAYRDLAGRLPNAEELRYWTGRVRQEDLPVVTFELIQQFPEAVYARPRPVRDYQQPPGPRPPWMRLLNR